MGFGQPQPDESLLAALSALADSADSGPDWPAASWDLLRENQVLGWCVPPQFNGAGLDRADYLLAMARLAEACLTTTFILSQRDAAIRRLVTHAPQDLLQDWLPRLSRGVAFVTVGISHLTTSRRHRPPPLVARPLPHEGWRVDGEIPWVTGADRADAIVTGAALEDGRQVLLFLPMHYPNVAVGQPLQLAALTGSRTAVVQCAAVELDRHCLLAGPALDLLAGAGGGGLETSALALGLVGAATSYLHSEVERRANLQPAAARFRAALDSARDSLNQAASGTSSVDVFALRAECTGLALRATQAALLAAKGTGFALPHPAQRWARQALFFLVWSCPQPVTTSLLDDLMPNA